MVQKREKASQQPIKIQRGVSEGRGGLGELLPEDDCNKNDEDNNDSSGDEALLVHPAIRAN